VVSWSMIPERFEARLLTCTATYQNATYNRIGPSKS